MITPCIHPLIWSWHWSRHLTANYRELVTIEKTPRPPRKPKKRKR